MPDQMFVVSISAGPHDRSDCPIRFRIPSETTAETIALVAPDRTILPAQRRSNGEYAAVVPHLSANSSVQYQVNPDSVFQLSRNPSQEALVLQNGDDSIELSVNGNLLTRYVYGDVPARPYFYPLIGPAGTTMTRGYPMDQTVVGEMHDHPHHRSLWIAHGDVNGTDNWSEEPNHGFTRHRDIRAISSGTVAGGFETVSNWETNQGAHLLTQRLECIAWVTGQSVRLIDLEIDLSADRFDVTFGDTKEGGIASIRVASAMDVPRGGRITNSYGGIDEGETWGRAAHWCDYSGLVSGSHCGIAVLDHPASFRNPTPWHVRNYGLMTANPFGWSAFTSGKRNGTHLLQQGEILEFRYRIVLHLGDAHVSNIAGHYINYACPPRVAVTAA